MMIFSMSASSGLLGATALDSATLKTLSECVSRNAMLLSGIGFENQVRKVHRQSVTL